MTTREKDNVTDSSDGQPRPHLISRVPNIAEVIALLATVSIVLGWGGRWHFALDLFSHFRVQTAYAFCFSGLVLAAFGRWKSCLVVSLCLFGVLISMRPFFPAQSEGRADEGVSRNRSYRLLTLNVLTGNQQKSRVFEFVLEQDPDFILLQETNQDWIEQADAILLEDWPFSKTIPRSDNFGIAIYSKNAWESCETISFTKFKSTPSLIARIRIDGDLLLQIINTHPVPPVSSDYWDSRNDHFAGLADRIALDRHNLVTIIGGDLNCSPWSLWFRQLVAKSGLSDSSVGHRWKPTWNPLRLPGTGLGIDHVLHDPRLKVTSRITGPDVGSDHYPIVVDFLLSP